MKTPLNTVLVLALAFAWSGCKKAGDSDAQAVKPYRETSFDAVTRQLDPGGSIYGYLSTDQWMAGLSTNILKLQQLADLIPSEQLEREHLHRAIAGVARAIEKSGVESLTGVGVSGVQVSPELFRTKLILHHNKGRGDGVFWNIMGEKAHALTGIDLLPEHTALAAFGDVNVRLIWSTVQEEVKNIGVPELSNAIAEWPQVFEQRTQIKWNKFLDSLNGEVGFALTLNDANMVAVPFTEGLRVPEPGILLAVKVNDDLLYDRISGEMEKSGMARMTNEKGLRMAAIRMPIPVPLDLELTVARSGDYLFVASSSLLVREVIDVQSGKERGLRGREDFVELLKYLPDEGNHFFYTDRRFSGTIQSVQKSILSKKDPASASSPVVQTLLNQKPKFGMVVGRRTSTGWESVSVGNQDSATALVAAPAAGGVIIGSAMLLPALAKAKDRAQSISCMNNMKSIGIAFRVWAGDHDDSFSFNLSRQKGGTLELCDRDAEGFDRNAYQHLKVMADELSTPKILVCPEDKVAAVAAGFSQLSAGNVSYKFRSGKQVSENNPLEVLAICPIHGHVLTVDGAVKRGFEEHGSHAHAHP